MSVFDFDVVVVAFGSRPEFRGRPKANYTTVDNKAKLLSLDNGYNMTDLPENLGWQKGCNLGIALSTAPYVVLCNDDITVKTEDWLEKFKAAFEADPKLGLIGPMTDPRWPQGRLDKRISPNIGNVPQTVDHDGVEWTYREDTELVSTAFYDPMHVPLSFFCVAIRREVIEDVGYLDERFRYGYGGDDNDYQWRAHLNGWKIGVHTGVHVEHEGSASYGRERRDEEQPRNVALLKEKWGMK